MRYFNGQFVLCYDKTLCTIDSTGKETKYDIEPKTNMFDVALTKIINFDGRYIYFETAIFDLENKEYLTIYNPVDTFDSNEETTTSQKLY